MLKVVGPSLFQTRISACIIVAVFFIGIGTIILGEFRHVENDETYSATVTWGEKEGYRIEFWGQGNNLSVLPQGVARAYYKTGILETGWSIIEIETHPDYPDEVQAFAAGLLEGGLTWQLIYHHWYNTIKVVCTPRASACRKIRRHLRENAAKTREKAKRLQSKDPFWHMVRLFYIQLDGMESGWKFAVKRSRESVVIDTEDFLWLAMASDLVDLDMVNNIMYNYVNSGSTIFVKTLLTDKMKPLTAFAQNTAAPYAKMLRLLKRYKFGYHLSPASDAELVAGHAVMMTSYPGALSSQDENYIVFNEKSELVLAGIPIVVNNCTSWNHQNIKSKYELMSPARIMAANRLATDGQTWSHFLGHHNSGTSSRQWVIYRPRSNSLWLVEQIPSITQVADYTQVFETVGFFVCTGVPVFPEIRRLVNVNDYALSRIVHISKLQKKIDTFEKVKQLMTANLATNYEPQFITKENFQFNHSSKMANTSKSTMRQILSFRGDIEHKMPIPFGVIDTTVSLLNTEIGTETFEATSGPPVTESEDRPPFSWLKSFPNSSHIGQPDVFHFRTITPNWIWI